MVCFDSDQVALLQAAYRQVLAEAEYFEIFTHFDRSAVCDLVARAVLASADKEELDLTDLVCDALDRLSQSFVLEEVAEAA